MTGTNRIRHALPGLLQILLLLAALIAAMQLRSFDLDAARQALDAIYYGDRLRQTSDDLTRMARLNAVTGDPLYREYFDEILDIRNGAAPRPERYHEIPWWDIVLSTGERPTAPGEAKAIRELFAENIRREADLALLLESEDQSNVLTQLENEVMDNVAAWREAGAGDYALEGAALDNMLRLHGAEYHEGKEGVMRPLVDFLQSSRQHVSAYGRELLGLLGRNFILLVAAVGLSTLLGIWNLLKRRARLRLALPAALQLLLLVLALSPLGQLADVDIEGAEKLLDVGTYADRLRQTSDDLTRMARLNAITGEPLYREYFDEILAIRNGTAPRPELYHEIPWWDIVLASGERPSGPGEVIAIRQLFEEKGMTAGQLSLLLESEDRSNALAELEYEVMDQVAAWREAGGGVYALEGAALDNMLRLHGAEYHAAKEGVMRPLAQLTDIGWQRTQEIALVLQNVLQQGLALTLAALGLALLAGVGMLLSFRQ